MRLTTFFISLALILAGVISFIFNLGYGSWGLVQQITRLWPVGLILIGLSLFWGGRVPRWLAFGIIVALAAAVAALVLYAPRPAPDYDYDIYWFAGDRDLVIERSRHPVSAGDLVMSFGGGRLTLGSATGQWLEGEFDGRGAITKVEEKGDRLEVRLRQPQIPPWTRGNIRHTWDLELSPELDWDLVLTVGAVDADLDFSGLKLHNLNLKLGAGDLDLKLGGRSERLDVKVDAGASDLRILVPQDVGVSINLDSALAGSNLDELGWPRVGGRLRSPGYDDASARIDLDLNVVVGNLELERYAP